MGYLDGAHNKAGITSHPRTSLHEGSKEGWNRGLDMNLKMVWWGMKYEMLQRLKQEGPDDRQRSIAWNGWGARRKLPKPWVWWGSEAASCVTGQTMSVDGGYAVP